MALKKEMMEDIRLLTHHMGKDTISMDQQETKL